MQSISSNGFTLSTVSQLPPQLQQVVQEAVLYAYVRALWVAAFVFVAAFLLTAITRHVPLITRAKSAETEVETPLIK